MRAARILHASNCAAPGPGCHAKPTPCPHKAICLAPAMDLKLAINHKTTWSSPVEEVPRLLTCRKGRHTHRRDPDVVALQLDQTQDQGQSEVCVWGSQGSRTIHFARQRRKGVKEKARRASRPRSARPWEGGHVQTAEKKQTWREALAWLVPHPHHAP